MDKQSEFEADEQVDLSEEEGTPSSTETEDVDGDEAEQPDEEDESPSLTKRLIKWALLIALPAAIAFAGWTYWESQQGLASTDNAYVQQDRVSVTSQVGGPIVEVFVKEGQYVEAGEPLFRIDGSNYKIALRKADAAIANAQVDVQSQQVNVDTTAVDIAKAQRDIAFAQANFQRQSALWEKRFTTKSAYDAALHDVELAKAELQAAQARKAAAQSKLATAPALPGQNPEVASAKVQRDEAQLNLDRTIVRAPVSGRVAQVDRLQIGQMMTTGLPALSIVVNDKSWVEANFKETDLDQMQPGQKVKITFDAFPELKLSGHVVSIGAGTGSEFSVLPAQNATGNWVKVTQRVPVRIEFDKKPDRTLIAGISATVEVDLGKGK